MVLVLTAACSSGGDADTRRTSSTTSSSTTAPTGAAPPELLRLSAEPDASPDGSGRIVDSEGREVRLRGVNVNALVEYWEGRPGVPTVFPLGDDDPERIAGTGWNVVRLLVSWSLIEPEPGRYDEDYLDEVEAVIDRFADVGVYSIIDLHQDAWGPSLAAPDGTTCPEGSRPALGWDGAPEWATLDGGAERCAPNGIRELSPAVMAAWSAFFGQASGPGGVSIQNRYIGMLIHVAERFAERDEVAGIDLMNEPGALGDEQVAALSAFYQGAMAAIREAEGTAGAEPHLLLFEPPALWSATGSGPPPPFTHGDDVVYAPHIYTGGFANTPITEEAFTTALDEARELGGVPVLSGEWGADPARAGPGGDGYFVDHQTFQDQSGISATLWTWRESCGDPHKVDPVRQGEVPTVWGLFEVDCRTNEVSGTRDPLARDLRRGWIRAAPGRITGTAWNPDASLLTVVGEVEQPGPSLEAWLPCGEADDIDIGLVEGLDNPAVRPAPGGGCLVTAPSTEAEWSLSVTAA